MPKFSIIVPIYNVEEYIHDCIKSLQYQSLAELEIILVDDGSTDHCGEIIDRYAEKDPRIKIIHKENEGVGAARNDGMRIATGEYISFCDADDMMEPDSCEELYNAGIQNQADVVLGDVYRIIDGKKKYEKFFATPFSTSDRKFLDDLIRTDFSRKYCPDPPKEGPAFGYGGPWNKAVRREFIIESGISFDESLKGIFDDILYTAYLYAEADKVVYISSPIYDYRILQGSVTHSFKAELLEINEAIFNAWNRFLEKYGCDGKFDEAYNTLVIRRLKGSLGAYFFNEKNPDSINKQRKTIRAILKEEPYHSAIKNAKPQKLINLYDVAVWFMARLNSPIGLQFVYKIFLALKK